MKRPPISRMSSSAHAFSLVELLVTTGIIGILAALGTQALQSSMSAGRQAEKVANLRSIGVAHGIFIAESNGQCLPANTANLGDDAALAGNGRAWWPHYLLRISGAGAKIFKNPDYRRPDGSKGALWDDVENPSSGKVVDEQPGELCRIEAGFGWNWYQSSITPGDQGDWVTDTNQPRSAASVARPSKLIVCLESMSVIGGPNPSVGLNFDAWMSSVKADPSFWAGPRWSKGAISCLFFDGHVAQMKPAEFQIENFTPLN